MDIKSMLYSAPAVIAGLSVHEFCHAWAALKLGDTTARDEGRVTLNPIRHIDPLGMIFILIAGFGWAKPVRFRPEALKNPRRDKALIAAAGPVANLVLGLAGVLALRFAGGLIAGLPGQAGEVAFNLLLYFAFINLGLFVFNLLPLPPLDGSHIAFSGLNLPDNTERALMKYGAYALFAVILIENRIGVDILPVGWAVRQIVGVFS